jgi:hypothetical protein
MDSVYLIHKNNISLIFSSLKISFMNWVDSCFSSGPYLCSNRKKPIPAEYPGRRNDPRKLNLIVSLACCIRASRASRMTSNEFGVIFLKSGIAILSLGSSLPRTAFESVGSVLHRIHARALRFALGS